jgi:hypothetical protein
VVEAVVVVTVQQVVQEDLVEVVKVVIQLQVEPLELQE